MKSKYHEKYFDKEINLENWLKNVYRSLIQRVNSDTPHNFPYYKGRGVKCNLSFEQFVQSYHDCKAHLLKKPSIDRLDNQGNYELGNIAWIEKGDNSRKAVSKAIEVFNAKTHESIGIFESAVKALVFCGAKRANMCHCLKGRSKTFNKKKYYAKYVQETLTKEVIRDLVKS